MNLGKGHDIQTMYSPTGGKNGVHSRVRAVTSDSLELYGAKEGRWGQDSTHKRESPPALFPDLSALLSDIPIPL